MNEKQLYRSGLIWLLAGLAVTLYACIGMLVDDIPGIELLIDWLQSLVGWWVLLAVFIAIFIEGLYFVGSFFPGSSIVVLLAILSQTSNPLLFAMTIVCIFVGWLLSGIINILLARRFALPTDANVLIREYSLVTWLPSLRANQEVSQTIIGVSPWQVFLKSTLIKMIATMCVMGGVIVFSKIIDVNEISNDEGFATLFVSASIMIWVGMAQLFKSKKPR